MRTQKNGPPSHPIWPLQDAKARFSEVIRATAKGPQFVSVRGEEEAVILSKADYERLLGKKKNFIAFINQSPFKGLNLNIERDQSLGRDIEL
jgi:antitoxin Phd